MNFLSRLLICVLFLFSNSASIYAQTRFIDSLETVIATQKRDSFYVKNLVELGIQTRGIDLQVSQDYFDQVIDAALLCSFERGEMLGYYHRAVIEYFRADFIKVDSFLNLALFISKKRGDLTMEGGIENIRGIVFQKLGQLEQAINSIKRSASIALQQNDSLNYAAALGNIAEIHLGNKNYAQAEEYYHESLGLLEKYGEPDQYAGAYIGLASSTQNIERKKYYSRRALQIGEENNIPNVNIYALSVLGEAMLSNPDSLVEAEQFLERGLRIARDYGEPFIHCSVLISLGNVYLKQKKYDLSENTLIDAFQMSTKNGFKEKAMFSSGYLSELYEQSGKLNSAYKFLKLSRTYSDSLYNENLTQQIQYSNAQFESEKRETEILRQQSLLEKQKNQQRILSISAFGTLFFLSALFFGIYQRIKRKRRETEIALQLEHQRTADLEELAKVKTDFFNNVSHELRTPLTLIISPLEDALPKVQNIELKKELGLALKNSKKLLSLTNEILDLSKIDEDGLGLELQNIGLIGFLMRVFHSFDSLAKSRKITLVDNLNNLMETGVCVDVAKLEKILNNLISNAIKYSGDASQVVLHIQPEKLNQGKLLLSLSDQGKGISQNEQEKIFERFYQSRGTPQSSGTGIGLALVKELCSLMGGDIQLESKPGQGSTFIISIPLEIIDLGENTETTISDEPIELKYTPILINGQKPTILFVEDDPGMTDYLISLFDKEFSCEAAYNGKQALEKLSMNHYDLISTDIMMPEMDGFEFRKRINENEKWKNTPFIMLTARILEEDKLRGFQLGIDDYITKPFSSAEIKARIRSLLKNKLSRDTLELGASETLDHATDFIKKAEKIVQDNLENPDFGVISLAAELNYSSRQLGRILQKHTGLSPVNFILEIRLQKAYQLIRDRKFGTIKEVRYEVGIDSPSYFSMAFKNRFGLSPGELV